MVVTDECYEAFCKSDETNTQCSMIDYALDSFFWLQVFCSYPKIFHQQWELFCHCSFLELEALIELFGGYVEDVVQFCKEHINTLLLVLNAHTFDGKLHDIDS